MRYLGEGFGSTDMSMCMNYMEKGARNELA
jgi:hypothetical protein